MTVNIKQGKFAINGKDVFLYGGEFHYFRVPQSEWQDRLNKLKEAGCNLVSTYVPWVWHEMKEGQYDLTGETRGERNLKAFLELVKESGLYCIVRPGPYVMAEVRYEGVPHWLLGSYPEVIARRRDGSEHPTRVVSYRHPIFLEKAHEWYKAVNKVIAPMQSTKGGPVIMYQLCNEIGMLHWVTNTSDYNPDTLKRFEDYLKAEYGEIAALNEKYGISESSFAEFVKTFGAGLPEGGDYPSFHYEWGRFWRQYIKDYVGDLRQSARSTGIEVPFIVNVHGFKDYSIYSRGVDYPIGLSQLYKTPEFEDVVLAGDFYPGHIGYDNYHDLVLASAFTKAVSSKEQPLFSAEFQSGRLADRPRLYAQDLDLNSRTCIAHGMNAVNYYMFVAGENYENIGLFGRRHEWQAPIDSKGNPRPNYAKAAHLGKVLGAVGQRLLSSPKKTHTFVGFNPNDYMTEVVEHRDRPLVDEVIGKREHFLFDGIVRLLVGANIHFEAQDLLKPFTPEEIPSLWVFSTSMMEAELQQKLADYVLKGGSLVVYPELPVKDKEGRPCTILADTLELGEWDIVHGVQTVDVLDIDSVLVRQRMRFSKFDGEPVAVFRQGDREETAAYLKKAGKGKVLVLGLAMGQEYGYQLDVIRAIAGTVGIKGHLSSNNPDIAIVERSGDLGSFLFVSNYDELVQEAVIYENGQPLFEGETLSIPPRSGAMLVRNYALENDLRIAYATVEVTGLRMTADEVEIDVHPFGESGTIKFETNGKWSAKGGSAGNPTLTITDIHEPQTLRLTRLASSVANS
ncbi:beta-galactosidase [Paenibacillus sediminis]|uniref:Beta-galactosidase n=1 Tax=Paenibacillus sediminis TaxID=664909 RepID=A0ABS4GZ73_9BACL|nr:beta-galactosidase [Paenibacillus sediminis]MBP1935511.1 beta-galactosidase [Paenibacillus sediminis]